MLCFSRLSLNKTLSKNLSKTMVTVLFVMSAAMVMPLACSAQSLNGNSNASPEIALILQGGFYKFDELNNRAITGFLLPETEKTERGFRLKESELSLSAAIDPAWSGNINFAFEEGQANVEEAWLKTNALGQGLNVKIGRFLSGFGYLNSRHSHDWDFSDTPLMYRVLFGGEQLAVDGLQLKWLAPTDLFVELGADVGRSEQFPASQSSADKNGANAFVLFAHVGDDIGSNQSYRVGVSYQQSKPKERLGIWADQAGTNTQLNFSGTSKTYALDGVWQLRNLGDRQQASLKLQAEWFERLEKGDVVCAKAQEAGETSLCSEGSSANSRLKYQGFYVQSVYQFDSHWRVGLRYEAATPKENDFSRLNDVLAHSNVRAKQSSVMIDYASSEFARFRLQLNQNKTIDQISENQVMLQYTAIIGKHAAHSF